MTEQSGPDGDGGADDGFQIPVVDDDAHGPRSEPRPESGPDTGPGPESDPDSGPARGPHPPQAAPGPQRAPAGPLAGESGDWTRGDSVRDDPGTLGEEVRKLWEVVHNHFVDPVLRNYPEAAGHLGSAGVEVASAFRALLRAGEQRWTGKPPAGRDGGAEPDWDGRIVIGEDGGDTDEDTADRPKD